MRNKHFHIGDYQSKETENRYQDDAPYTNHPKVDLNGIVEEQVRWLQMKGYDEKGLNNNEEEGSYKTHLQEAVQHIIDSDTVLLDKEPFTVHAFGLFDEGKDKALFNFSYEFNSFDNKISLIEVEAIINQVPLTIAIETFDDLWHSKDLYQRVKELSVPICNAVHVRRQESVEILVNETNNYLKALEYEKYSTRSEGWIARRLTSILNKAEKKPNSIYYFSLHTNLQNGAASVKTTIHFEYITKAQHLTLKWVQAKLGDCKEISFQTSKKSIPKAGELINTIQHKKVLEKAHKISLGPAENARTIQRKKQ